MVREGEVERIVRENTTRQAVMIYHIHRASERTIEEDVVGLI